MRCNGPPRTNNLRQKLGKQAWDWWTPVIAPSGAMGSFLGEGNLRSPSSTAGESGEGWAEVHLMPVQDEDERLPDPWGQVQDGSDSLKTSGYR